MFNNNRHSENKSNRFILYSRLINNINNIRNNSKSINNIKNDQVKKRNNRIINKSSNITKKIISNQINIRVIQN